MTRLNELKGRFYYIYRRIEIDIETGHLQPVDEYVRLFHARPKNLYTRKQILEEDLDEIREELSELMMELKKKHMQHEINVISAEALISSRLKEKGYQYMALMQVHRVKLQVRLNSKRKAVFFLKYRTLREDLEKLFIALGQLESILETFGNCTGLISSSDKSPWEGA